MAVAGLAGWRAALVIVQPRTVIDWQRKRFRDHMIAEALALPTDDRTRLHDHQGRSPSGPHPRRPEQTIRGSQPWAAPALLIDRQLVAQGEDLDLQGGPGADDRGEACHHSNEHGAHGQALIALNASSARHVR